MNDSVKIVLPWVNPLLNPNKKLHYLKKAKLSKESKNIGIACAIRAGISKNTFPTKSKILVFVLFHAPSNHGRDSDNLLSSCKWYLDGIAEVAGINDRLFRPVIIDFADNILKEGAVEITLYYNNPILSLNGQPLKITEC